MGMPQVNVTLPAEIHRLLVKLAAESGKSLSGLAADCIELGLMEKVEQANKRYVFLATESKRQILNVEQNS